MHTHTAKAGFLGRQAALLAVRPRPVLVHTFHGHVLEGYFGPAKTGLYRSLERTLARRTDRLIGVSRQTVEDLVRLGVAPREKFSVIPVGLELEPFASLEQGAGDDSAPSSASPTTRLCSPSSAGSSRSSASTCSCAPSPARAPRSPVHLAIVGDGETRGDFERLAGDLGVGSAVSFLGYRRDLPRIAAAADAAVLSSDNEGTPVWLIEAAAAGRPAIATDVGGTSEVVTRDRDPGPAGRRGRAAAAISRLARGRGVRAGWGPRRGTCTVAATRSSGCCRTSTRSNGNYGSWHAGVGQVLVSRYASPARRKAQPAAVRAGAIIGGH